MPGTIYLDIKIGGRLSFAEVQLSKNDLAELYEEIFGEDCIYCQGPLGDSTGRMCCDCFKKEMEEHTDCCLGEEE